MIVCEEGLEPTYFARLNRVLFVPILVGRQEKEAATAVAEDLALSLGLRAVLKVTVFRAISFAGDAAGALAS